MTDPTTVAPPDRKSNRTAHWIAVGLSVGVLCGVLFGDYCAALQPIGRAYVGLLQMTVLPYLVLSLIAKLGRLNVAQAKSLLLIAAATLLVLWAIAIALIVFVSQFLPTIDGAFFYSPIDAHTPAQTPNLLNTFIPTNVFASLANEYVPAVVVFCLFVGFAVMQVVGKEELLDTLDRWTIVVTRINSFLVRLAPVGLFALTAAAAGTLRLEEFSRLQAYLIIYTLACLAAAFAALPLLLTSLTKISYRDLLRAAEEPMLTAIAAGKLFVVLPQITQRCEQLLAEHDHSPNGADTMASVVVPLAYPFPHVGKILSCLFISFAAWYVGRDLSLDETIAMAGTGTVSSFAGPLVTIPFLLDQYGLPTDLLTLFILPGFITTRLGDVVGVMHLMVLTLLVTLVAKRRVRVRWSRLLVSALALAACLSAAGLGSRMYLASTVVQYDLDKRFLSLELESPHENVTVFRIGEEIPEAAPPSESTLQRIKAQGVLRVGYHPEHLPYTFINSQHHLVGMDVELMHGLAKHLDVRLEFVPCHPSAIAERLNSGAVDVVVGGLVVNPQRLLSVGFTAPYQRATLAIVTPNSERSQFETWDNPGRSPGLRLGTIQADVAAAARYYLADTQITTIDSTRAYFEGEYPELDGLLLVAEEAIAWNVLYPAFTVVVPEPAVKRPVGMAVRSADTEWLLFLNGWLDYARYEGTLDHLHDYWVLGGGTESQTPRWSVIRNVLHWVP